MTVHHTSPPHTRLRSLVWPRWTIMVLAGLLAAQLVYYHALPHGLRFPLDDEDIWLRQPWRIAALTAAYYTPLCGAQWLVLRRSVPRAWWWVVITWGAVVVLYPASVWSCVQVGHGLIRIGLRDAGLRWWDLAADVWFAGLGGITVYGLAQWAALRRWTRDQSTWVAAGAGAVLCVLGAGCVLSILQLVIPAHITDGPRSEELWSLVSGAVYQSLFGGVIARILPPLPAHTTSASA